MKKTLLILGTGGTIAGRAASANEHLAYQAGQVPVADLLGDAALPAGFEVEAEQIAQIDSKDMSHAVWRDLLAAMQRHLQRTEVQGIVITHGTDTLEETAFLLQRVCNPSKPVVLVSAMRPASAAMRDGPQNLSDGLLLAATPHAQGVIAVCAGKVHSAWDVTKVHPYRLDAFDSGQAGPVAAVQAGQLTQWRAWPHSPDGWDARWLAQLLALPAWPRVEWITSHAGHSGELVRALLLQQRQTDPASAHFLRGLVVAGTGNGTLHADLLLALDQAQAAGVVVWRSTRCAQGWVLDGEASTGIASTDLPPAKARLELMLRLVAQTI